jgi:hypothetical protein
VDRTIQRLNGWSPDPHSTPLMAFIGTILTVAIGFLVHAYLTDDTVQHRHGVQDDPELKKIIGDSPRVDETGQKK